MIHYVTYATHSHGMFQQLIHNRFGTKINVLGWGKKWNGFMDKYIGMIEFCNAIPDNDFVVFLDGFDTEIKKNPIHILSEFHKHNCDVLLSKDIDILPEYMSRKMFGTCQNGQIANSGMYMGKSVDIKELLRKLLVEKTDDDQRALNSVCKKTSLIVSIDTKSSIFHNGFTKKHMSPYFVSYPGAMNGTLSDKLKRYYRAVWEYGKYFVPEILLCICVILLIIYRKQVSKITRTK